MNEGLRSRRQDHDLSAEARILVCCARRRLSEADRAEMRALLGQAEVDWALLSELAVRHRLLPLLAHHLTAAARDLVPDDLLAELRAGLMENTRVSLWVMREMFALTTALEDAGVRAIPFKGTTLSRLLYGAPNLRSVGDLDVIVPAANLETAIDVACRMGYRYYHELTPARRRKLLRHGHHVVLDRQDGMYLELHWKVAKSIFAYAVEMEAVWDRSEVVDDGQHRWRALASEDLVPILAIQASKEAWRSLERICSLAEAARLLPPERWDTACRSADAWKAGRTLRVGLLLAERVLGAEIPGEARAWIGKDAGAGQQAQRAAARLFRPSRRGEELRSHLGLREGVWRKAQFLLASAFISGPEDWDFVELPDRVHWMYTLIRPARLLSRRPGRIRAS